MSPTESDTVAARPNRIASDAEPPVAVGESRNEGELFIIDNSDSEWSRRKANSQMVDGT